MTSLTTMTLGGHDEPMVAPDIEQQIIDAICQTRDQSVIDEFETYGSVMPGGSHHLARGFSAGTDKAVELLGGTPYGDSGRRTYVEALYRTWRKQGKIKTKIMGGLVE